MRTLVVYFSNTGHTQTLAQQIAAACGADTEGLCETSTRTGALFYLQSLLQAALHTEAPIAPLQHRPEDYELLIIGTPIWAWNMSSPVRTFIRQNRDQFRKLALFCTCDGAGQPKVLRDMQALCGITPVATLGLTTAEMHDRFYLERLGKFLQQVKQAERADAPATLQPRTAL